MSLGLEGISWSSSESVVKSSSVSPPDEAVECVGETRVGAVGGGAVLRGVGKLAK